MSKILLGLALSFLASTSIAAADPLCGEYDKLRAQRDNALRV